ncbi:MAG: hypothetical protein EAZ95_17530 [Bacteroidetes bacterium]|nr:MAG: hypothetical protein EAZ95_17530 [Bacteroidota bacterium]
MGISFLPTIIKVDFFGISIFFIEICPFKLYCFVEMTAENLQNLLAQPYHIAESELEGLEELVAQYPYFQLGHLLIAKYAHDQESMLAPQKIRRAAVYAFERRLLRQLINALPPKEMQAEGKTTTENLGQEFKNSKSFFDLLPPIDLDESAEGYKPQAEKQQDAETRPTIKELLKEPVETIWENQLSEGDAITLFNVGKIDEAKQLYEELAKQYPEKATEYAQRWAALSSNLQEEHEPETKIDTPIAEEKTPETNEKPAEENIDAFFEDIAIPEGVPDYLHYNEGIALGLYYDGKEKEAIEMYKKLMEFYPEKKDYYQEEAIMLVGKKAYFASFENVPAKTTEAKQAGEQENLPTAQTETLPTVEAEQAGEQEALPTAQTETLPAVEVVQAGEQENLPTAQTETLPTVETEQAGEQENLPTAQNTENTNIHEFFEHIETPVEVSHKPEIPQNEYLTEEERPFFDSIEKLEASEPVQTELPPLEIVQTDSPTIDEEAVFLTESQAIAFFNQGKLDASVNTYEQLIKQNPIKTAYYESQIRVLRETMREALRPAKKKVVDTRPTEDEELSEDLAIRLFTQDKMAEAIAIYEQLIEHNPSKRMHYLRQIEVLKS